MVTSADVQAVAAAERAYLIAYAYQLTHSIEDAQDLVQDAVINVLRAARRRELNVENAKAYMMRVISNEFLTNERRLQQKFNRRVSSSAALPDAVSSTATDKIDDLDELWHILAQLPHRSRLLLVMRYYLDLPDSQIAAQLELAESSVRSLAARSLQMIRARCNYVHSPKDNGNV